MAIISVERPQTSSDRIRFSKADCEAAADAVQSGVGASDGEVYENRKTAQQVAWELRHGMAKHADIPADSTTSRTVEGEGGYMFVVYSK